VTEGTPVRKSGILIGRVRKVEFAEQGGVNVTIEVDNDVKLYRSEVPQVSGSLLGGDVVIQFVKKASPASLQRPPPAAEPNGAAPPPAQPPQSKTGDPPPAQGAAAPKVPSAGPQDLIQPDDFIEGSVAPSPIQVITNLEGNLATAIDSLSNAGSEVGKLAAHLNELLDANDDQLKRIVDSAEKTLSTFQQALGNFDDVIGDEAVRESAQIHLGTTAIAQRYARHDELDENHRRVGRPQHRNLEGFTGPLARGNQIVDRVDRAVASLDGLLGELSDFGKSSIAAKARSAES
jgi:ABC-type transporter Mla subunit MlaD